MLAAVIVLGDGKWLLLRGRLLGIAIRIVTISNFDINVAITVRGGGDVVRSLVVTFLHVDVNDVTVLSPRPHRPKAWLSCRLKPTAMHLTLLRQRDVRCRWELTSGYSRSRNAKLFSTRNVNVHTFNCAPELVLGSINLTCKKSQRNSEKTKSIYGNLSRNLVYQMHEWCTSVQINANYNWLQHFTTHATRSTTTSITTSLYTCV